MIRKQVATAIVLLGGLTTTPSFAAPSNETAAEAAFAAGRTLMRQGRYEEACKKLETSLALDPALGTLLNLAECLERSGRTASAWVRYREAAGMALRSNQREREVIAREKATELERSLCHLVIRAPSKGIVVRLDGVPIAADVVDLPVPVDPGTHIVEAMSGDTNVGRREVLVRAPETGQACPDVAVSLEVAPGDQSVAPVVNTAPPPAPARKSEAPSDSGWYSTGRGVGLGLGIAGLAGIGVGTVFGLFASSAKSDAEPFCTAEGCLPEGKAHLADAGQNADIATIAFIAGTALLAGGIALWFVAPPSPATGPRASVRTPFSFQF